MRRHHPGRFQIGRVGVLRLERWAVSDWNTRAVSLECASSRRRYRLDQGARVFPDNSGGIFPRHARQGEGARSQPRPYHLEAAGWHEAARTEPAGQGAGKLVNWLSQSTYPCSSAGATVKSRRRRAVGWISRFSACVCASCCAEADSALKMANLWPWLLQGYGPDL